MYCILNEDSLFLKGIILLIKQQINHYRALNAWFLSPLGLAVASQFSQQLQSIDTSYLRGDTLLQLGCCGENPWLNALLFYKKWLASPFIIKNKTHLECSLSQIPLNRSSVDCVLLPLTLEPFGDSLSLINEIDRVLKPMGFVIILSINPWSLWGGAMKCGLLDCYHDRQIKMRSSFQVNRIFLQRGYKQLALSNFCYLPPSNKEALIKRMFFFDEIGRMLWPFPAGFYCYIAQKFEYPSPSLIIQSAVRPFTGRYKPALQPICNLDLVK